MSCCTPSLFACHSITCFTAFVVENEMKNKTGGPAFPISQPTQIAKSDLPNSWEFRNECIAGMTLRDWFAGMALCRLASGDGPLGKDEDAVLKLQVRRAKAIRIVQECYEYADAMIKEKDESDH
jgi:hypothetical protein